MDLQNRTLEMPGLPFPAVGNSDTFSGSTVPRWPHIIFQLFWYPPTTEDKIVLVGEAAAPPIATLGPNTSTIRLPLDQWHRRAPRNAIAFEEWNASEACKNMQAELHTRANRRQKHVTRDFECERDCDLRALQQAMDEAYSPAKTCDLLGEIYRPMERREKRSVRNTSEDDHSSILRLTDGSYVTKPVRPLVISSPQKQESKGRTSTGTCYLDVDLAWTIPQDRNPTPKHDVDQTRGALRIDLRCVYAPSCHDGFLRVRVCEVEVPFPSHNCFEPQFHGVDASLTLAQRVESLEAGSMPALPEMHPVWTSKFQPISSPQGAATRDPHAPKHFAQWNDSVVVKISQCAQLVRARRFGLLSDAMDPIKGNIDPSRTLKVDFTWTPVQLPAPAPMARCSQHLVTSAFFEAPYMQTRTHHDCAEEGSSILPLLERMPNQHALSIK
jgi:hypothetical protein